MAGGASLTHITSVFLFGKGPLVLSIVPDPGVLHMIGLVHHGLYLKEFLGITQVWPAVNPA